MRLPLFIPRLSDNQIQKLSDITSDIGLVSLASIILPAMLDKADFGKVLLGVAITIVFWLISLKMSK